MTEQTELETVETVLRTSSEYLDLNQIVRASGQPEDAVKAALKALAGAGQIEHIAGAGRRPTRYGWLATGTSTGDGSGSALPAVSNEERESPTPAPATEAEPSLEQQIVDAQKPDDDEIPFDPFVPPAGYLVKVPKRKPRIVRSADRAMALALAARRNGASSAEVFELVPIGRARLVAEFDPA